MRSLFTCLLVSTLASSAAFAQSPPQRKPVISLSISSQPTAKVGSTVAIHVVLTNTSTHEIVIEREVRGTDCTVDVRDASGKLAPDTKFGLIYNGHVTISDMSQINPSDLNGASVNIPVKSGKTWEWTLDAAKFYDMSNPGKYAIFIQRLEPEDPVKSNTISVTMTP